MSATILECVNGGLVKLGADRITTLADASKNAREANAIYQRVLDAELRKNTWRSSVRRITLLASILTPAPGYSTAFEFPSTTVPLRLIQVGDYYPGAGIIDYVGGETADYAYEGGVISINDAGPVRVKYVGRPANTTIIPPFDALFAEAYACKLAMELAEVITASDAKRERASREYREAIMEAIRTNAIEAPPNKLADDSWILSRL
jgi:hypothetical protein